MTRRTSVIVEMCELNLMFRRALGFGQRGDSTHGCEQSNAAFGLALELAASGCVSELAVAGNGVTILAAVVVEDERGHLMRALGGRHFFQFCETGGGPI